MARAHAVVDAFVGWAEPAVGAGVLTPLGTGVVGGLTVVDHHDLWAGNVLVNRDALASPMGPSPYVVIDWAGANLRGGGFADVVRAARAFGASDGALREELILHCGLLGLWPRDAMSQAMLSLAGLYERLECFPERTFAEVASRTAGAVARVFGPEPEQERGHG